MEFPLSNYRKYMHSAHSLKMLNSSISNTTDIEQFKGHNWKQTPFVFLRY